MSNQLPKPTGYFTHDLTPLINPIENAPENPERLASIELALMAMGYGEQLKRVDVPEADVRWVRLAHAAQYIDQLALASAGNLEALSHWKSMDTPVAALSYRAALKSVNAVLQAIDQVLAGTIANAFCGVRPPGHHAGRASGGGFCYFNNVAIGALYAAEHHGLERVAVLDFDVHHGDGTEEILGGKPGFQYYSIFQWPLYPSRLARDVPANVVRSPLSPGATGADFRRIVEEVWLPGLEAFAPQLILLSAGFDAHTEELVAQLKVDESDYAYLTRRVMDAAEVCCEGRLVSVLEGGYSLRSLSRSVVSHVTTLLRRA